MEPAVTGAALLALSGLVLEPKLQRLVGMRHRYVLSLCGKAFSKIRTRLGVTLRV